MRLFLRSLGVIIASAAIPVVLMGCNSEDTTTHPKSPAAEDQPVPQDVPDPTKM